MTGCNICYRPRSAGKQNIVDGAIPLGAFHLFEVHIVIVMQRKRQQSPRCLMVMTSDFYHYRHLEVASSSLAGGSW